MFIKMFLKLIKFIKTVFSLFSNRRHQLILKSHFSENVAKFGLGYETNLSKVINVFTLKLLVKYIHSDDFI